MSNLHSAASGETGQQKSTHNCKPKKAPTRKQQQQKQQLHMIFVETFKLSSPMAYYTTNNTENQQFSIQNPHRNFTQR